jgi:hypothetical protein
MRWDFSENHVSDAMALTVAFGHRGRHACNWPKAFDEFRGVCQMAEDLPAVLRQMKLYAVGSLTDLGAILCEKAVSGHWVQNFIRAS